MRELKRKTYPGLRCWVALALLIVTSRATAMASEYGVSTYRPGLIDLYSGMLPKPGMLLVKNEFLFQDADNSVMSNHVIVHTRTRNYNDAIVLLYVSRLSLLGAHLAFASIQMARISSQSMHIGVPNQRPSAQNLTVAGIGDGIFVPAMLGWDLKEFHIVGAFAFYAPTGKYDPKRIISIGLNRWAFEPDIGITWMGARGQEASLFTGYTINTTNTADDYRSGDEFHVDFAAVQHFPEGTLLGIAGYALQQTTADSGNGATLGPFRGRVIGLGPMAGYTIHLGERPIDLTFKYDIEFAEQNRSSGNELWLTASIAF